MVRMSEEDRRRVAADQENVARDWQEHATLCVRAKELAFQLAIQSLGGMTLTRDEARELAQLTLYLLDPY